MDEMLGLFVAFGLGVVLCGVIAHRLAARWRIPWQATLTYFGVLDDGPADSRRRRPARLR